MDVASAAAEVKLWKLGEGGLDKPFVNFTAHEAKVNCIRWNHNNQVLVSCGDDGAVVLSHQSGRVLGRLPTEAKEPPLNSLAFSSGSRYLCSGGGAKVVDVWDLKHKKKTRTFTGHKGSINSMVFAKGDTKVASGSDTGDVLIHSVVTGTTMCTLDCGQDPIRDIQYSPHRPSILSTCGDDSCVSLWDTNSSSLLHKFSRVHHAPVNQVIFSPVTQSLLASVGLDKKIIFYDIDKQRTVKQIVTEHPLSCMAFRGDGVNFVVGTTNGALLAYDFRKSDTPTHEILHAHESAVNCVQYQHSSKESPTPRRSVPTTLTNPVTPEPATSGGDLFSPIKSALTPYQKGGAAPSPSPAAFSSYSRRDELNQSGISEGPGYTDLFSPNGANTTRASLLGTPAGVAKTPGPPKFATPLPRYAQEMTDKGQTEEVAVQQVDVAVIQAVVEEAVGKVRASLKDDINNLHLELLRQFHVQQMELREMLESFTSKYEGLIGEVKDLRTNYEDLRHIY